MGYTYTPTYYSSLQDSIASICKSILPFSFKKPRLPPSEQKLSKQQTDNLKWQQNSYHKILNLMGLHKEGILPESDVSAFRTQLLETLIASKGVEYEQPPILRDKLIFLQELLYAKCISAEEYHASKRPLLQRLAVQGAEIEARDVIVGSQKDENLEEEEWSVIDLRDEQTLLKKENSSSKNKSKYGTSAIKHIKDAASVFGIGSSQKQGRNKEQRSIFDLPAKTDFSEDENRQFGENPFCNNSQRKRQSDTKSVLTSESTPLNTDKFGKASCESDKGKKKAFRGLFHKDGNDGDREADKLEEIDSKSARKPWAFDAFKRWKKSNTDDETAPLHLGERSSGEGACMDSSQLVSSPIGKGPDTKHIKTKLLSDGSPSSGFFIDKVLGDKIKKELSRIQSELSNSNPNFNFSYAFFSSLFVFVIWFISLFISSSFYYHILIVMNVMSVLNGYCCRNDQMDAISTKLPVDKADLKQFFPKSWCERYGDVVLDVVKKEFKDHVGEMENTRNAALERRQNNSKRWTMFEDDENTHPNLFPAQNRTFPMKQNFFTSSNDEHFECGNSRSNTKGLNEKSAFSRAQNPFMNGSSVMLS